MKKSILLVGCGGIGTEVIKKLSGDKSICVDQVLVRAESRIIKISDQMHQKVINCHKPFPKLQEIKSTMDRLIESILPNLLQNLE